MTQDNPFTLDVKNKEKFLKNWWLAARPRTLSISFVPLLIGTLLAYRQGISLNRSLILFSFLSIPWIQVGMNFINDALDFERAKKLTKNLHFQRAGLLTYTQLLYGGYICFGLAFVFGLPVMWEGGWGFVFIYLISIFFGYAYTGGPFPLSYLGISDAFILIFYGWVSTMAMEYLQTEKLSFAGFLAGTQIGLLAIVPHAINNLRDYVADALVHKKTIIVRFGRLFGKWEITLCSLVPFLLGLFWLKMGETWMAFLPFLGLPFVLQNVKQIWEAEPKTPYHVLLAKSAGCQLLFAGCLALGIILEGR